MRAVADWEHDEWWLFGHENILWGGELLRGDGNDKIIRDRPGSYRAATGDAYIDGGSGTDTISYAHYTGGIEIDLSYFGFAKAKGPSGVDIFGEDGLA